MTTPDIEFAGSIPENYDRLMGAAFFEPYARDAATRLPREAKRVLELACGTGIVTRALRAAMPAPSVLTATDLSEGMVEYARAKLRDVPGITFRAADACALPFDAASFNAVVCQFGIMFVPDKAKAYREARRVLAPGGRLIFSVWDGFDANPVSRIAHEVVARLLPNDPPQFLRIPFGSNDGEAIQRDLRAAGFASVTMDRVSFELRAPAARDLAAGHATGTPLANALRERREVPLERLIDEIAQAIAAAHGDHPVIAPMRALVFTAVAPMAPVVPADAPRR